MSYGGSMPPIASDRLPPTLADEGVKHSVFDPGRISALSDGVFAIAMTLLVLNLQLPDVGSHSGTSVFVTGVVDQLPCFVLWLLSFAILCRLWTVHHDLLAEGDTRTRSFARWNFVFLGAVSFIPFPTSLLAEHPERMLSVVIFSATYVVAGIALGSMARIVGRGRIADGAAPGRRRNSTAMLLILATAAGSCLLAIIDPRLGAVLWFSYPITGGVVRRHDPQVSTRRASTATDPVARHDSTLEEL